MTGFGPRVERMVVCGLLVLCALCSIVIAHATSNLELANARRREQLQLLDQFTDAAERLQPGPVAELDGLFARRLAVVTTVYGQTLAFVDGGPRAPSDEVLR